MVAQDGPISPDKAVYVISVAAELTGLHPQTLRTYERLGLIVPGRTPGGGRRYSHRDIELLRTIATLSSEGIGLEGVRRILALEDQVSALRQRAAELQSELQETREALRAALAARRTAAQTAQPAPSSRLPAVVPPGGPGQSMVLWRRGGS